MRGKVTRKFDRGIRLEPCDFKLVAVGDFNLWDGTDPISGKHELEAVLTAPGRGVVARLGRAAVTAVAGFGMVVSGIERVKIGGRFIAAYQEWWFVPTGHEDPDE
jgi:hypothetical protein